MIAKCFIFISILVAQYFNSLFRGLSVPTMHLDGAFQTASGLFRLDAGQLPGKDFFPYLGIGPLFALFPLFKIGGGDLAASTFSSHFVTVIMNWLCLSTLVHLMFRPNKIFNSLIYGAVLFWGGHLLLKLIPDLNFFNFGFNPSNSLRPIRSAIPYFVGMTTYLFYTRIYNPYLRSLLIGCSIGLAFIWSNDFGFSTALIFLTFYSLYYFFTNRKMCIRSILIMNLAALITGYSLISIATANHFIEFYKYNFLDVAQDQWWYFGDYRANYRIFTSEDLIKLIPSASLFSLIILLTTAAFALKKRSFELLIVTAIGSTLLLGGCVASIGGHISQYFGGFKQWSLALLFVGVSGAFLKSTIGHSSRRIINSNLMIIALIGFLILACTKAQKFYKEKEQARSDSRRFYIPEYGGYLPSEYKNYIEYIRQNRNLLVVEDYWGLWNSLTKKFPPWPVDSTIHALGNIRDRSKSSLDRVDAFVSTRFVTSPEWQPWNISQNFWFYDALLVNWEPSFISPTTLVWKKSATRRSNLQVQCEISPDQKRLSISPRKNGFYRISLRYKSKAVEGRYLLMFKNNISYGGGAHGYVSLKPGSHLAVFPIYMASETDHDFYFKIIGSGTAMISDCNAEAITYSNEEILRVRIASESFPNAISRTRGLTTKEFVWSSFF